MMPHAICGETFDIRAFSLPALPQHPRCKTLFRIHVLLALRKSRDACLHGSFEAAFLPRAALAAFGGSMCFRTPMDIHGILMVRFIGCPELKAPPPSLSIYTLLFYLLV
jgi:hypothetical protein